MLPKLNNPDITAEVQLVTIEPGVSIYVKTLRGPRRSGRTAIYIHGGGGGGNHTIIERPSRHLINDGFFDTIILPDKRGDGGSSPLTGKHTILNHARDMRLLLEQLNITGPITALGISYGGPIALGLAHLCPQVERVVLVASSPSLAENSGISRLLLKSGLLRAGMKLAYRRFLGKLPQAYVDFDACHDLRKPTALVGLFTEALKRTPRSRLDSLIYALEATLDTAQCSLPDDVQLSVPVIQVVGERDEVWGGRIAPRFIARFPRYRQYIVPGARIHKDALLKPAAFYGKLAEALKRDDRRAIAQSTMQLGDRAKLAQAVLS